MSEVTIYHNPKCSASRNTLALILERGIEARVIEYLASPPSKAELQALIEASGLSVRELMRSKEAVFGELGLAAEHWSDSELLDAMLAHPILINRPIVVTARGVRLCRPPETVLEILP